VCVHEAVDAQGRDLPLFNADVIHHDAVSYFHFDAEHALVTDHAVLDVRLLSENNASTDHTPSGSLSETAVHTVCTP